MTPLSRVGGAAWSLPEPDVDTDIIYPARFLLITGKQGLGRYAFGDRRRPGFPLAPGATEAPPILIAGPNFGCGSSREQAAWALAGLGVRVIVAESFGEIFFSNCFRNGMLPIRLPLAAVATLRAAADAGGMMVADVVDRTIAVAGGASFAFWIDDDRREALLNGWNDTTRILALHGDDLARFEERQRRLTPWLWTKETA